MLKPGRAGRRNAWRATQRVNQGADTMVRTESTMMPLGTAAPDFTLPSTEGGEVSLEQVRGGRGLLVAFICNHCPYVKHIRGGLAAFARDYASKGINTVAISANDIEAYPQDNLEAMAEEKRVAGYDFPYLLDETQEVAKAYGAACTPDFFLFDADLKLVYRGRFDAATPGNDQPVDGRDLRAAADALLRGETLPEEQQRPSMGCNIKWKPGNEPAYF
ncbi:Redoxin domain protein [Alkalilimnicola ehrlichii MLHE-1]|uniref:Redoxin domain protein n=2 Tax=Alkalilimnicola ehrlichii TaxID=351052 RepID=Q0A7A5_ALKEH|nr:Redoxin domain protein [Alkalilimnicola ehrlichii MLHE-1]